MSFFSTKDIDKRSELLYFEKRKGMNTMTRKQILVAVLCAVMLFSALFIALEAHHDCTGEECAICVQLRACAELLRQTALVLLILAVSALLHVCAAEMLGQTQRVFRKASLITLKIKLSD